MRESESERGGERARGKTGQLLPLAKLPSRIRREVPRPRACPEAAVAGAPGPPVWPLVATSDAVLVGHSLHRH